MNKDFLYSKPYVPGIIDDTPVDLDSWFLDDSRERMEEKLRNSPLSDLIIEFVNIFKDGEPNYQVLLSLLGEKVVKEVRGGKNVYCQSDIFRPYNDIKRIEIEIDEESLIIKKMSVYVDLASFVVFEKEITSSYVDVHIQEANDAFSISVKDKIITLLAI